MGGVWQQPGVTYRQPGGRRDLLAAAVAAAVGVDHGRVLHVAALRAPHVRTPTAALLLLLPARPPAVAAAYGSGGLLNLRGCCWYIKDRQGQLIYTFASPRKPRG